MPGGGAQYDFFLLLKSIEKVILCLSCEYFHFIGILQNNNLIMMGGG